MKALPMKKSSSSGLYDMSTKSILPLWVTSRCSGNSFLNRVELQNGCLALGHANLFILSTIAENRKRGALKAAETRRRKKQEKEAESAHNREEMVYCGVCHQPYVEFTDEVELWLRCDICSAWCHFVWACTLKISHRITFTVRSARIDYLFLNMLLTWLQLYW